jgi:hypothetical protein
MTLSTVGPVAAEAPPDVVGDAVTAMTNRAATAADEGTRAARAALRAAGGGRGRRSDTWAPCTLTWT